MDNKKFLITGVKGFVAAYFLDLIYSKSSNIKVLGLDIADYMQVSYPNFNYKKIDLTNKPLIYEVLDTFKPDYILHLASASSVAKSWEFPSETFVNNTNIFLNLVESLRELGQNPRILSIGSSEEYGAYTKDEMPLKESYELKPTSPYSVARVSQEMISKIYADNYNLDIIMTRSFNHIGAKQSANFVIPSFVKQLCEIKAGVRENKIYVGNIDVIRDFLDVQDVVEAYLALLLKGKKGEVYNVCSSRGTKLREIIKIISEKLEIEPQIIVDESRIRPTDNEIIIGDNSKIKEEIGWEPLIKLEKTLEDMILHALGG